MRARAGATLSAILVAALIGASSASAQVSTGHSGWFWGNPSPQGEPLYDVSFADGVGYAVGAFGTALRTTDNGATWTNLPTGLFGSLTEVDAVSANTVIVGGGCVLRRSDDGGSTFARLPWTASDSSCPQPITAVDFPTADTGYLLLSGGTILRTEDGGQSWARATAPSVTAQTIAFSSASTGFAAGGGIYETTDGGNTWTLVDPSAIGVSALALDGPIGVVALAPGDRVGYVPTPALLTSGDGGVTWTSSASPSLASFGSARAQVSCDPATGCLLSGSGNVYRTTDGASFQYVTPGVPTPSAAVFAGPTQAVVVTEQGVPYLSSDGGATFAPGGAVLPPGLLSLRVSSGALATLAGPGGEVALTSDGGRSWSVLDTPTTNAIDDASFLTASSGFALDATGAVLRTENGGSSWQTLSAQAGESTILALDATHLLVAGSHGIERSTNGGQSFTGAIGAAVDQLAPAVTAIVASGPRHAYVSSDGGATWRAMGLPVRFLQGEQIRRLDFTSARAGFLLGTGGRVFATGDGGKLWHEVLGLGHLAIQSIAFTSARNGWAAEGDADGTPGEVLRTSDGGTSWRPQRVNDHEIDELAAAGHEAYALNGSGDVFATDSTGDLGGTSSISLRGPRKATKHGRVIVTGSLGPRLAGASIEIDYRPVSGGLWVHHFVTAGGGGRFSLGLRIRRATAFVAQWAGDTSTRGAGSAAVIVAP